jgi:hypothetical protein
MMAHNLYRLGLLLERHDFMEISQKMLAKIRNFILTEPQWVMNWASLATYQVRPTAEIAIVGENLLKIRADLEADFQPNKIFVGTKTTSSLPLLQGRISPNQETTIYVCFDKTCQLPTTNIEKAKELLENL